MGSTSRRDPGRHRKKDALIKQANEKLEILTLRAPKDGVANIKVAVGDRVTEESVLATMEEPGGFTAIFTLPEGAKSIVVDSEVEVVAAAEPERKSTCRITSASDSTVTATCPSDSALKAGDKVELQIE